MSNLGQAVLSIGGAVIGFAIGGPIGALRGFYGGYLLGSVVSPTELPTAYGPRLDDLKAQGSTVGGPIPLVYGTFGLAGNIIWAADLVETKHEDSVGGKGGGGTQKAVSYSYSQSFAVGLCQAPIQGIRRIWANGKLIYDRTPQRDDEDADTFTRRLAASDFLDTIMEVYTGDQIDADPTIETYEGVGNVPAYKGLAYVVFTDMQLADYGQRAPQLQIEVYTDGYETVGAGVYSNEFLYPWNDGQGDPRNTLNSHQYRISPYAWTTESSVLSSIYPKDFTYAYSSNSAGGTFTTPVGASPPNSQNYGEQVVAYAFANVAGAPVIPTANVTGYGTVCESLYYNHGRGPYWATIASLTIGLQIIQIRETAGDPYWTSLVLPDQSALCVSPNYDIKRWTYAEYQIKRVTSPPPNPVDLAGAVSVPGIPGIVIVGDTLYRAQSWVYDNTHTYKVLAQYTQSDLTDEIANVTQYPLNPTLRSDDPLYSDEDYWTDAYNAAVSSGDMPPGLVYGVDYPVVQGWAYVNAEGSGTITVNPVNVADIVADLCERCGVTHYHYDVSDIDSTVDGYAVPRVMTGRDAITPLTIYGLFRGIESDVFLKFVERGAATARTLTADDIGAHSSDGEQVAAVTIRRTQDIDLPQVLRVHYASADRDYQPGEQQASRLIGTAENAVDLEIPVSMSDTKALQLAEIYLFDAWVGRNGYEFSAPFSQIDLEPTDCIELPVDGVSDRVCIVRTDATVPGIVQFQAVRDDPDVLVSYAAAATAVTPTDLSSQELPLPGPTDLVLLDLPGLRSTDNDAGYYAAGRGYLPIWSGYTLVRSLNGGTDYRTVGTSTDAATMGVLANEFDLTDAIEVTLYSGSFASATTEELDAGANLLAVGADGRWELLQFETATLDTSGVWILSGLRRGLRDTSAYETTNLEGDSVVLMSGPGILRCPLQASLVGVEHLVKPVSLGNSIADTTAVAFTSSGLSLQAGGLGFDGNDNLISDLIYRQVFGP